MSCEKAVIEKALIISRQDKREKNLFIAVEFYVLKTVFPSNIFNIMSTTSFCCVKKTEIAVESAGNKLLPGT